MRLLSRTEANDLLLPLGLEIGSWNRLNALGSEKAACRVYRAPQNARELYVLAGYLVDWVAPEGWVLLQVDNSTAPSGDEERVFERLVFNGEQRWDVGKQRSFLFGETLDDDPNILREQLILLAFFALMFEWHVYLTCKSAGQVQRLGLQDGSAHFIGEAELVEVADAMLRRFEENPLKLSQYT